MDATLKMPFNDAQVEVLQLLASDLDSYELKEEGNYLGIKY